MKEITNKELIEKAKSVIRPKIISEGVSIGDVGCALITATNKIHLGVSIDACCGIGFCAEHSAIASMATSGEYIIKKIVAVLENGTILSPCGRCRELMYQIDKKNWNTEIIIDKNRVAKLRDLLPDPWQENIRSLHN